MEGSALAEENVAQPNAGRTQSRETVSSRLSRVRHAALGERQLRACFFERLCDAMIRGKSRMSQCSRTDLCGGCRVTGIPTATLNSGPRQPYVALNLRYINIIQKACPPD